MTFARRFARFVHGSVRLVLQGNAVYWAWIAVLVVLIGSGVAAYLEQFQTGLMLTSMRDPVSWGFYIGNFTFLVGVAAAAVVLVIPAYVYDWKPIREIVIIGELLAVSAIVMCMLFVMVDIGQPGRFWHLIPPWGHLNLPSSILAWDVGGAERLPGGQLRRRHPHPVSRLLPPALREAAGRPAGAAVDPDGGRDPHGDRVSLQRPRRAPVLELVDPRAAVPGLGLLLRPRDPAGGAAAAAPLHPLRDPGPGDLEDRRADGLRDVPQPVPARRRSLQGVLLRHRAPALHAVLVPGPGRGAHARALRLDGGRR